MFIYLLLRFQQLHLLRSLLKVDLCPSFRSIHFPIFRG